MGCRKTQRGKNGSLTTLPCPPSQQVFGVQASIEAVLAVALKTGFFKGTNLGPKKGIVKIYDRKKTDADDADADDIFAQL